MTHFCSPAFKTTQFGKVYLATTCNLDDDDEAGSAADSAAFKPNQVAVRMLRPAASAADCQDFLREAVMTMGFNHPNVVRCGSCLDGREEERGVSFMLPNPTEPHPKTPPFSSSSWWGSACSSTRGWRSLSLCSMATCTVSSWFVFHLHS